MQREGPLNWLQSSWLSGYKVDSDDPYGDNLIHEHILARPEPLDRVVSALTHLVNRHESLRTQFSLESGDRIAGQRIAKFAQGSDLERFIQLALPDDYPHVRAETMRRLIRIVDDWPFRVVLRHRAGTVDAVSFIVDHSACDGWGRGVLAQEFSAILDGDATAELPSQPLDLVEWERSDAGRKHLVRGLAFWSRQLEHVQEVIGGAIVSDARPVPGSSAPFRTYKVRSRRLFLAARKVSSDAGVPISTLALHSYGLALSHINSTRGIGIAVLFANRSHAGFRASVSNMFTCVPVVIERYDGGERLNALVETYSREMGAYVAGAVDPVEFDVLTEDRLPNATSLDIMGANFNYRSVGGIGPNPAVRTAKESGSHELVISSGPLVPRGAPLMLDVRVSQTEMELRLTCRVDLKWDRVAEHLLRLIVSEMCPELVR